MTPGFTLPSANGYVETRTYDRPGRLVDVESQKGGTTLAKFALSLDPAGNPLSVVRTGSLAQTQTYTYDASDRLLSVCFQAGTCPGASDPFIRWTYDKVGNRLTEQRPGQATANYGYDFRDRLLTGGSTSYTYDQNGNELSAGTRTFTYDLANRLKTTTQATTTTTYLYDGDGVRLQASTGTQASKKTNFLWDVVGGLPQIALERDGNNSLLRRYTYGVNRISMASGNSTSYYIRDGLGSTANLTSSSGSTEWTWSYEPFGSVRTETKAPGSQPDNLMKFTGEYLDPTGLYHLRARQYDPAIGRFMRVDPVFQTVDGSDTSAYSYSGNRPTVMVDPSGETFTAVAAGRHYALFASSIAALVSPACGGDPNPQAALPTSCLLPGIGGGIGPRAPTRPPTGGAAAARAAAAAAAEAGTIMRYSVARQVTAGLRSEYQAHHLLEVRHLRRWGYDIDNAPAVVMLRHTHQSWTNRLQQSLPKGTPWTKAQVRRSLNDVYASKPEWLRAIRRYVEP